MKPRISPIAAVLLATLVVRLYGIGSPVFGPHNWRQSDTAAIARNFYEGGFHLLLPQVDWRGATPGYVEMECPIYNWAVAALYAITGPDHAWARVLSILGGLATIYFLYRIADEILGRRAAIWSALLYALLPMNMYYGRAVMPESWMLGFSVAGVYLFLKWARHGRALDLVLSCIAVCLACLIKLPMLHVGLPLLYLAVRERGWRTLTDLRLWAYCLAVMAPVVAWYAYSHDLGRRSGLSFGIFDKPGQYSLLLSPHFYWNVFVGKIAEDHLAIVGAPVVLAGLTVKRCHRSEGVLDAWLVGVLAYIAIAPAPNAIHEYYQLPAGPPLALFMGKLFAANFPRYRVLMLAALAGIVGVGGVRYVRYIHDERPERSVEWATALVIKEHTSPGDLVVVVSARLAGDPSALYYSGRKGWTTGPSMDPVKGVQDLADQGAALLAGPTQTFAAEADRRWLEKVLATYPVLEQTDRAFAVRLAGPRPAR